MLITAIVLVAILAIVGPFLPPPLDGFAWRIVSGAMGLACPLFFLLVFFAPGLFRQMNDDVRRFWERIRTRRHEIEALERKIAHLDKPHHMVQLATVYFTQGRFAKATQWLEQALEREPDSLDAQYRLALCHFSSGQYGEAADLLEKVHAVKPEHDYGTAYLRLAQSQQRTGNAPRASELYEILLRFYPGHAEGSYDYAQLLAGEGNYGGACQLMKDLIFSVRHSPGFQRRRNRHWMLKARWWLLRHERLASAGDATGKNALDTQAEEVAQPQDQDDA